MSTFVYLGRDRIYSCGCVWRNYGMSDDGRGCGLVPCKRHMPKG
jgi:hypothetical protein